MKLIFATGNKAKLREAREILGEGFEVVSQAEAGVSGDVEETGATIGENSAIKAREIFRQTGGNCFADDTGLEVEALGGAPGVLSARYARSLGRPGAESHDSQANISALLDELGTHDPGEGRRARFHTVITLILDGKEYAFDGEVCGSIAYARSGNGGFGYDPVFLPDETPGRSMADISEDEKNAISHRGRALRAMAGFLARYKSCHPCAGAPGDK